MMNLLNIMSSRCACRWVGAFSLLISLATTLCAGDALSSASPSNSGAKIEFVTQANASAQIVENNTLRCQLPEGETTFVISFASNSLRDQFSFLNENAAACGELKIAVSNEDLPAGSPKWTQVDGAIAFAHKRLFNLSMVGIDARFLRLSFHVEKSPQVAGPDLHAPQSAQTIAAR